MRERIIQISLLLLLPVIAFVFANAQDLTTAPHLAKLLPDQKLSSRMMGRDVPYRVIVPSNYDEKSGHHYPVIYLLHGLSGHFDNWTDKTKLTSYAGNYDFIIVMPEGDDGWYTDSVTVPNDRYESYIVNELVPEIDRKFRTLPDRPHRIIAGLSMGGYGSIKFGLKYSNLFSLVGSFSGAFDAPMRTKKSGNNW